MLAFTTMPNLPLSIEYSVKSEGSVQSSKIEGYPLTYEKLAQERTDGLTFVLANKPKVIPGVAKLISYTERPFFQVQEQEMVPSGVTFTLGYSKGQNTLEVLKLTNPILLSGVRIPIETGLEVNLKRTSFKSFIKDGGIGNNGGSVGIGNLEMTLEVYRLCEYRFKFPKNYLRGLKTNSIAYAVQDTLIVHTWEIGEVILYTDAGTITVRSLPTMKVNKTRLKGVKYIEPIIHHP